MATILPVPESEKRVLENLLRDLNEAYPDKVIVRLQQDHKNWSEKVTRLYKNIGYASRDEFLAVYGFTVEKPNGGKGGRPSADLNAIVEELISRYEGDKCVTSMDQLKEENPDLAPKFKNIANKSKDLFGKSFTKYLMEKGVIKSADTEHKEKLDAIITELEKRYEGREPEKTAAALKDNNSDIDDIANIGAWIDRIYGKKALEFFVERGLVKEKEKKPEKTDEQKKAAEFKKLSPEEKLRITTEELKARITAGDSKVETIDELVEKYPDLPIKTISSWSRKCMGKGGREYLVEEGILMNTREIYLSRIDNSVELYFVKYRGFLFEETPRYREEITELSKKIENLGGSVINLQLKHGIDPRMSYGDIAFFVTDPDDKSVNGEDYYKINDPFYRSDNSIPIITIDYLKEQLEKAEIKKVEDAQIYKETIDKFRDEDESVKLKRAVDMFVRCVQSVEQKMDKTNDYNRPIVTMYSTLKGKCVARANELNKVNSFLDAIKEWMHNNDMNYDYDSTPEEIISVISKEFFGAAGSGRCWIDGFVGVRIPVGIAVAFINYAAPFADIQIDFAHDKWEARGEYSMGKRVGLVITQYNKKEKVKYYYYEKRDM